jgi:hypothetical protein
MEFGDVINELHDHYSFAYTGTTKCADLAAFQERTD